MSTLPISNTPSNNTPACDTPNWSLIFDATCCRDPRGLALLVRVIDNNLWRVRDRHAREELAQAVLCRIGQRHPLATEPWRAWVRQQARDAIWAELRRKGRSPRGEQLTQLLEDLHPVVREDAWLRWREILWRARLDEDNWDLLRMLVMGLTREEIGERLGMSAPGVSGRRNRLRERIMRAIRAMMGDDDDDDDQGGPVVNDEERRRFEERFGELTDALLRREGEEAADLEGVAALEERLLGEPSEAEVARALGLLNGARGLLQAREAQVEGWSPAQKMARWAELLVEFPRQTLARWARALEWVAQPDVLATASSAQEQELLQRLELLVLTPEDELRRLEVVVSLDKTGFLQVGHRLLLEPGQEPRVTQLEGVLRIQRGDGALVGEHPLALHVLQDHTERVYWEHDLGYLTTPSRDLRFLWTQTL